MAGKEFIDLMQRNIFITGWLQSHMKVKGESASYSKQHLRTLMRISIIGRVRLKDLSKYDEVPTSNLCTMLKHLVHDGLIKSQRDKADHRNVWYSLSKKGETFSKKVIAELRSMIAEMFSPLNKTQEKRLSAALKTMNEIMGELKQSYINGEAK
ncbi:MAG: MarR family transcriptional regulator [Alphaproteobacteria bacterium]|nr:MarR family transcriptional regulator [Alphaproteobacteria bacterium]